MSTIKPDLRRTWAAGAPGANVVDPDITTPGKFNTGWVAEIPPFEHFNFLQKIMTQGLAHNNEQGINKWDTDTTYPIGGYSKGSDNQTYISLLEQSGNDPVSDDGTNWINYTNYKNTIPSTSFFAESDGARIQRFNDRLFLGGATLNDGDFNSPSQTKDWLEVIRDFTTSNSQFAVLSTIGQTAVLGGSRTSDFNTPGSEGCIGGNFWSINDNNTEVQTSYGLYVESRRSAGAGTTHGAEFEVVNSGSVVDIQPYSMFAVGATSATWIGSGGELSANNATAAIGVIKNGAKFQKGIVFHSESIEGTDGLTGSGVAIELAKGHAMRWLFDGGNQGASINSDVSDATKESKILFSNNGLLFRNSTNKDLFTFGIDSTHVNGLFLSGSSTGGGSSISATGDDADVDLTLIPKGSGLLGFSNVAVAGSAGAAFGFITVNINGTPLKLQLFNV